MFHSIPAWSDTSHGAAQGHQRYNEARLKHNPQQTSQGHGKSGNTYLLGDH